MGSLHLSLGKDAETLLKFLSIVNPLGRPPVHPLARAALRPA